MIYLDYSATTPVNPKVLDNYLEFNRDYFGNPNSTHELGLLANHQINKAANEILNILKLENYEVIFTSGATEANNLALKGFAFANMQKGKHIITSPYEHSSVIACLNYLAKFGFDIDILPIDKDGLIDINVLDKTIREDTILVSISKVNSELGIKQDLAKIIETLKKHPQVKFHSDMTQAIGKHRSNLEGIDLISFTGHKIYGLKGIGALLRKKDINLDPVIHGGKSYSIFRGGTPSTPLINSLMVALRYAYQDFEVKIKHVEELNRFFKEDLLKELKHVELNYKNGIPQIINVSFLDIEAQKLHKEL